MKTPPVGILLLLAVVAAIVMVIVGNVEKSRAEREEHLATTRAVRMLSERYHAVMNMHDVYESALPKGGYVIDALSIQKEAALKQMEARLTNGPVLFLGKLDDVQMRGNDYYVLLKHAQFPSPFRADLRCSQVLATRISSQRKNFLDTFAVIAFVSSIEVVPPSEHAPLRFLLRGSCADAMYCGNYWPKSGDLPNNGPSVQVTRDVQQAEKDHRGESLAPQP